MLKSREQIDISDIETLVRENSALANSYLARIDNFYCGIDCPCTLMLLHEISSHIHLDQILS
ncbi:hypothetical protein MtrunA17_Chr1g0190451 [Medicago truncatula]|nr:hypothetical protein MtrunA17_Chr1g0190451 [Medicago truncatula]